MSQDILFQKTLIYMVFISVIVFALLKTLVALLFVFLGLFLMYARLGKNKPRNDLFVSARRRFGLRTKEEN